MLAFALLVIVAGCDRSPSDSLDALARDYVLTSLTIGEKEEGYIDAYYGPPELQAAAKADAAKLSLEALSAKVAALRKRAAALATGNDLDTRRARFLEAQLTAAETRLRMMRGEKLSFVDEAEGLFGVRPEIRPLASYDPIVAGIEELVPGTGALPDRVENFSNRFVIPSDKLKTVFDAAIAECRRRTLRHIALPAHERFDLAFVTGKSWGGYNYYQGNAHSRIEINTDLPSRIDRALDLGCHEGYPGHHVLNALLEQKLTRGRNWIEFSMYPLYSPQSLLAEGSANYGIELAFPGDEKLAFETRALYPLAGIATADAAAYAKLQNALKALSGARFTIARDYLEGRIDDPTAVALLQRYQLLSRERAEKSLSFIKQYRSYVINYGLGHDMVRASVERAGTAPAVRWARMTQLLSEPTLPSDLTR
ncbi:hypothetical protein [Sphingomonas lutea]|uniref:hypothetical protein n=1 Tax=Sphingomonas lutea TaxID=1045317 RepID=UPI001F19651F|nr:hypothetical protein [Sphingomonas lutea]